MINLAYVSLGVLTLLLLVVMIMGGIDYRRKRVLRKKPLVSFMVPCYNDGKTVKRTIRSIYSSYDRSKSEIIVVNDKSTDGSLDVLKRLKKEYGFILVSNKKNIGKARSLNRISKLAKHEVFIFVDADVIMGKKNVYDMLARLEQKNVMAVSCPYNAINKGFLALMQEIEYNMLSFLQGAHNLTSTLSLWGGCLAVRKSGFNQAGKFSLNAIVEDMDLALKLNKAGYKVEQSFVPIRTYVPTTYKSWYKQKIRWTSGGAQCFIRYPIVWLKSPLHVFFILLFSILSINFIIYATKEFIFINNIVETFHLITTGVTKLKNLELTGFYYGAILLKNLLSNLYFTLFSIPYVIPMIKNARQSYKLLYLVPFTVFYYPLFTLVSTIGIITGFIRYRPLMKSDRAW